MDWTNQPNPEIQRCMAQTEATLRRIEERLSAFDLIQQQMAIMERLLDSILTLSGRSFQATLDPKAKELAMKEAKELAERLAKEEEERMEGIIVARGGDHPPTPEELARAGYE